MVNVFVEFPVTSEVNPKIADRSLECDESTSGGRVSSLTLWPVSQLLEFLFIVRSIVPVRLVVEYLEIALQHCLVVSIVYDPPEPGVVGLGVGSEE